MNLTQLSYKPVQYCIPTSTSSASKPLKVSGCHDACLPAGTRPLLHIWIYLYGKYRWASLGAWNHTDKCKRGLYSILRKPSLEDAPKQLGIVKTLRGAFCVAWMYVFTESQPVSRFAAELYRENQDSPEVFEPWCIDKYSSSSKGADFLFYIKSYKLAVVQNWGTDASKCSRRC